MAATPPSGSDISQQSNVVWTDPTWASGASPLTHASTQGRPMSPCANCVTCTHVSRLNAAQALHAKQKHAALQVMETRATRVAPRMCTIPPSRHFSCVSVPCGPRDALSRALVKFPRAHPISRRCAAPHTDGTGAMPIGNGDGTSSVWVDAATGDLRLLLSKSDVFDESGQPVKTGVLRLTFDPPLWKGSPVSMHTVRQSICAPSICLTTRVRATCVFVWAHPRASPLAAAVCSRRTLTDTRT